MVHGIKYQVGILPRFSRARALQFAVPSYYVVGSYWNLGGTFLYVLLLGNPSIFMWIKCEKAKLENIWWKTARNPYVPTP